MHAFARRLVVFALAILQRRRDSVFEYAIPDAEVWGVTASMYFE